MCRSVRAMLVIKGITVRVIDASQPHARAQQQQAPAISPKLLNTALDLLGWMAIIGAGMLLGLWIGRIG